MRKPISRPIQNIGRWRSTPIVTATTPRRNAQRRRSASVLFPFKPNESPLPPTRLLFTRGRQRQSGFAARAARRLAPLRKTRISHAKARRREEGKIGRDNV